MEFVRRNWKFLALFLLISIIYFIFRVPSLGIQPIFVDEAIYIRWAEVIRSEPTLRFIPLSDGKTPLFMWVMTAMFKLFHDPLIAGRMLSVFSGFGTMLGVVAIGWKFFDRRTAILAGLLVSTTPFFVFFDRLALVDSMLAAFVVWGLFVALQLISSPRLDLAMLLGYCLGGGYLTKTPGMFAIFSVPISILTIKKAQLKFKKLSLILGYWLIAGIICFLLTSIIKLGPNTQLLNSRDSDYIYPFSHLLTSPFNPLMAHLGDLESWFYYLLGPAVLVFILVGTYKQIKSKNRVGLAILIWSIWPIIVEMSLLRVATARYILFCLPGLMLIASAGFWQIFAKAKMPILIMGLVLTLIYPTYFAITAMTNLARLPLPAGERQGYLEDWTAGYGMKQIASYILDLAKHERVVVVGTEGYFGTLPDGLQIYLDQNPKVVVIGGDSTVSAQLRSSAGDQPTFFVANKSRFGKPEARMELIAEYPKIVGPKLPPDSMLFYQVFPSASASATRR